MKRTANLKYIIISLILAIASVIGVSAGGNARAETDTAAARYEQQNVWNDLQEATFEGEKIDLSIYNFDERKQPQIISFVEFCYSFYADMRGDFGLYVYVYNPKGEDFTKNEELNKIEFRYGGSDKVNFGKYDLKYLNRSEEPGFEGLFYKFKIALTDSERAAVLDGVNSTERIYEVSGIELYNGTGTNAKDYKVSNKYTYTGYALGYGSKNAAADTLNCKSEGMDVTLTLDVHTTTYMPEGTNGKDAYTRDCLHSVYFSIPNKILEKYGGLAAVHAQWLNATTIPFYVTSTAEVYSALANVAQNNGGYPPEDFAYMLLSDVGMMPVDPFSWITPAVQYNAVWGYNVQSRWQTLAAAQTIIERLPIVLRNYELDGEALLEYMLAYSEAHDGEKVQGKYNRNLFASVDEEFTDKNIQAGEERVLTSTQLNKDFWNVIFGGVSQVAGTEQFSKLQAIQEVRDEDFKGDDVKATCDNLYISERDYASFTAYYAAAKAAQKTTFLFRYYKSDYISHKTGEFKMGATMAEPLASGYFAQETVSLDFDIIDVTCRLGDVDTVIGVVSDPMDIAPDPEPPLKYEPYTIPWWVWVIAAVIVIVAVILLCYFFPEFLKFIKWLGKGLIAIIALPFKWLAALFRKISESIDRRRAAAATKARQEPEPKPKKEKKRNGKETNKKPGKKGKRKKAGKKRKKPGKKGNKKPGGKAGKK